MSKGNSDHLKKILSVSPPPSESFISAFKKDSNSDKFIKIPFPVSNKKSKETLPILIEPDPNSMRVSAIYRTIAIPKYSPPILDLRQAELENIKEAKKILDARLYINFLCSVDLYFPVEELRSLYRKGMRIRKIHLKYFTLRELVKWWLSKFPEEANLEVNDLIDHATQGFVQNEKGMYFFPVRKV